MYTAELENLSSEDIYGDIKTCEIDDCIILTIGGGHLKIGDNLIIDDDDIIEDYLYKLQCGDHPSCIISLLPNDIYDLEERLWIKQDHSNYVGNHYPTGIVLGAYASCGEFWQKVAHEIYLEEFKAKKIPYQELGVSHWCSYIHFILVDWLDCTIEQLEIVANEYINSTHEYVAYSQKYQEMLDENARETFKSCHQEDFIDSYFAYTRINSEQLQEDIEFNDERENQIYDIYIDWLHDACGEIIPETADGVYLQQPQGDQGFTIANWLENFNHDKEIIEQNWLDNFGYFFYLEQFSQDYNLAITEVNEDWKQFVNHYWRLIIKENDYLDKQEVQIYQDLTAMVDDDSFRVYGLLED